MRRKSLPLLALLVFSVAFFLLPPTDTQASVTLDCPDGAFSTCVEAANEWWVQCSSNGGDDCYCGEFRYYSSCMKGFGCSGISDEGMRILGCPVSE